MEFFPNKQGAVLITETRDANKNLLNTMTYRINKVYNYSSGTGMQIGFVMADENGKTIDNGSLSANCNDGNFYLKMVNRAMSPEIVNFLTIDTELVGDFLDYPNIFNEEYPFDSPFEMNEGEFTIQSKKDAIRVRIYNRKYVNNEKIKTPARNDSFYAAKITFDFEVTKNKKTKCYKGIEWYATNAGIIRSETYDSNNLSSV